MSGPPPPDVVPRLSVIAPCYNEGLNVDTLVARTVAVFDDMAIAGQLVLVDDGSADNTWDMIQAAAEREPRVLGARHHRNRGIESGWHTGLAASRGELVCLIDSDLQNRPEDIARLYDCYLAEKPDIVQAVRNPHGVQTRMLFSRALNALLNASFGMNLRDNKSGFILCKRGVLAAILDHRYDYKYFQSFIGVAAGAQRRTIAEVDTNFEPRNAGESFLSNLPIRVSLRICYELAKYRVESLRARTVERS